MLTPHASLTVPAIAALHHLPRTLSRLLGIVPGCLLEKRRRTGTMTATPLGVHPLGTLILTRVNGATETAIGHRTQTTMTVLGTARGTTTGTALRGSPIVIPAIQLGRRVKSGTGGRRILLRPTCPRPPRARTTLRGRSALGSPMPTPTTEGSRGISTGIGPGTRPTTRRRTPACDRGAQVQCGGVPPVTISDRLSSVQGKTRTLVAVTTHLGMNPVGLRTILHPRRACGPHPQTDQGTTTTRGITRALGLRVTEITWTEIGMCQGMRMIVVGTREILREGCLRHARRRRMAALRTTETTGATASLLVRECKCQLASRTCPCNEADRHT